MGRLERKLDTDLIDRIQGGWKPSHTVIPLKRQKPHRLQETYRRTRRNAWRDSGLAWTTTAEPKHRPYMAKPPLLRFAKNKFFQWQLVDLRQRKQPKTYPYHSPNWLFAIELNAATDGFAVAA